MKHSDRQKSSILASVLVWAVPLLLIIPGAALAILGHMPFWASVVNVALPLGMMLLIYAAFHNAGRITVLLFPFMFLAAFQIVLFFLYSDGSIIGVDMFLNVATTNSSEAFELLDNLLPAIATVVVLYLPPLIVGIVAWHRGWEATELTRLCALWAGGVFTLVGLGALAISFFKVRHYRIDEDFYPANVLCNLGSAVSRSRATKTYAEDSANYRFRATSKRPADERELYIAVVGETSRASNWQLFGYDRYTTPELCQISPSQLVAFQYVLSESNTTHKSVPLLLSTLSAHDFNDSINTIKSVISAFNEAGFSTAFVSMQGQNRSYIDFFANEADTTIFVRNGMENPESGFFDSDVLPVLDSLLAKGAQKQLVLLHLYGSHFCYNDRYPREDAYFIPDLAPEASPEYRDRLVNAYDNSIRQTDKVLAAIAQRLDSIDATGAMLYTADHGEDIYDDGRQRFLHASPTPTYYQLHVPMLLYANRQMAHRHKRQIDNARSHRSLPASSSSCFSHTLLHMAGIYTPRLRPQLALTSSKFVEINNPVFLNDRNRAETLEESGFKQEDFKKLGEIRKNFIAEKFPQFHK